MCIIIMNNKITQGTQDIKYKVFYIMTHIYMNHLVYHRKFIFEMIILKETISQVNFINNSN